MRTSRYGKARETLELTTSDRGLESGLSPIWETDTELSALLNEDGLNPVQVHPPSSTHVALLLDLTWPQEAPEWSCPRNFFWHWRLGVVLQVAHCLSNGETSYHYVSSSWMYSCTSESQSICRSRLLRRPLLVAVSESILSRQLQRSSVRSTSITRISCDGFPVVQERITETPELAI